MNQKNKISIQNGTFKYLQIAFLQDFGGCKTTNNQRINTKALWKIHNIHWCNKKLEQPSEQVLQLNIQNMSALNTQNKT